MFKKILTVAKSFLNDRNGISEIIGVAFLLIFVVFALGKPLQDIGSTLSTGYNKLNEKLNNKLDYLNQIQ